MKVSKWKLEGIKPLCWGRWDELSGGLVVKSEALEFCSLIRVQASIGVHQRFPSLVECVFSTFAIAANGANVSSVHALSYESSICLLSNDEQTDQEPLRMTLRRVTLLFFRPSDVNYSLHLIP